MTMLIRPMARPANIRLTAMLTEFGIGGFTGAARYRRLRRGSDGYAGGAAGTALLRVVRVLPGILGH